MANCIAPDLLRAHVARFARPDAGRAWRAFATSLPPFLLGWWAMYRALGVSYALTLLLALPTAGFVVRTFIVQHDCGHGTFFASRRLRTVVGRLCSLVTLVPFGYFRQMHAVHHATSGNLDDRGVDIETLTVDEYRALDQRAQRRYRLLRHPAVLFGIAPLLYFVVLLRWPGIARPVWRRARRSIVATDVALALSAAGIVAVIGWRAFLLVQAPITAIAATVGMWMFYVQHQFEAAYWAPHAEWDFVAAALDGSSYYALPAVLAWFTGYIGFHHIHHLNPRVPSYHLARCHATTSLFDGVPRVTLLGGFACARLALWDARAQRLVPFQLSR